MSVVLIPEYNGGTKQAIMNDDGITVLDFCLKTPTRCWIRTMAGDFGVASPWHLYLSMHFSDPTLHYAVLRAKTVEDAETLVRENKGSIREDFATIKNKILAWTIRVHLNARFKELLPKIKMCKVGDDVYYLSDSKRFGCVADAMTHTYKGENLYGTTVKKLIKAFHEDPTKFLKVAPPDVEGVSFLGSSIRTYSRTAFQSDTDIRPTTLQLYGRGGAQHKSEQYLES